MKTGQLARTRMAICAVIALLLMCTAAGLAFAQDTSDQAAGSDGRVTSNGQALTAQSVDAPDTASTLDAQFDGDTSKLDGTNWMSGIPSQWKLHEFNIPGTHDSCCARVYSAYLYAKESGARTQCRLIQEQLQDGVRLFDLRLTDYKSSNNWSEDDRTVWLSHGQFGGPGNVFNFVYYGLNEEDLVMSFITAMNYYAAFLIEHPTETLIVQVTNEYGNMENIFNRAHNVLEYYSRCTNPSTGKSLIYTQGENNIITEMPTLDQVRGQIVICSDKPEKLGYGMKMVMGHGWGASASQVGGVQFSFENHYESTSSDKLRYLQAFFNGNGDKINNETIAGAQKSTLPRDGSSHVAHGNFVNTSSNRAHLVLKSFDTSTPRDIADDVNPVVYSDKLLNTRGIFYGWVNSDFMTADMAKMIWANNYPAASDDGGALQYATVTYTANKPESERIDSEADVPVTVLKNGEMVLRSLDACGFEDALAYEFVGWKVGDDPELHQPGESVAIAQDTTIRAIWQTSWTALRHEVQYGGATTVTVDLQGDLCPAGSSWETIEVPKGKTLTLNLNGHTVDAKSAGKAFEVRGTLNIVGPGTVTGGSAGAARVRGGVLNLTDVSVTGNTAASEGGGVYVYYGTFTVAGKTVIDGNTLQDGTASNVYLSSGAKIGVSGQLTDGARIGVTTARAPRAQEAVRIAIDQQGAPNASAFASDSDQYLITAQDDGTIYLDADPRVTFATYGGSQVDTQVVKAGGTVAKPDDPTKENAVFMGWFTESTYEHEFDFGTAVSADLQLHAKWKGVPKTVKFLVEGLPVSEQTVEYGNVVTRPEDPTREGYVFKRWTRSQRYITTGWKQVAYNFDEPVTSDLLVTSEWTPRICTATFDSAGGSAVSAQTGIAYRGTATRPANPTRTGYIFAGWFSDEACEQSYDFASPLVGDITLHAKWIEDQADERTHTVAFDTCGGSQVEAQNVSADAGGGLTGQAADADTEGSLTGQAADADAGIGVAAGDEDADADGGLTDQAADADDGLVTQAVDADAEDGLTGQAADADASIGNMTVQANDEAKAERPDDPTRDGYTFDDWYLDSDFLNAFDFDTEITEDLMLFAKWIPDSVQVSFDTGGGTEIASQQLDFGELAVVPSSEPTRENYAFNRWFVEVETLDDEQVASLNAIFAQDPSLVETFWLEGNSLRLEYSFEMPVIEDTVLYARWRPETHTVSFDADGGSDVSAQTGITHGTPAAEPGAPTKDGFVFEGWFTDEERTTPFYFSTPIVSDLTVHAKWTPEVFDVVLDPGIAGKATYQEVAYGSTVEQPADPTTEGYTFGGWYVTDGETESAYDFSAAVTDNLVLHAWWTPKSYTVTFNTNGGSDVAAQTVNYGSVIAAPDTPTKKDCAFAGWYSDEALSAAFDFGTAVTSDVTLYAKWTAASTHEVSFMSDSSVMGTQAVDDGSTVAEPADGTYAKPGYVLAGWYADEACTAAYDFGTAVTDDVSIYAKWTESPFTVSFNSNGGSAVKPATQKVAYGACATTPDKPTRSGYVFGGWYAEVQLTDGYCLTAADIREYEKLNPTKRNQFWVSAGKTWARVNPSKTRVTSNLSLKARWYARNYKSKVVLSKTKFTFNGKVQRPTVKTVGGYTLKAGTDYAISFSSGRPMRAGTYTVTISGKGNYLDLSGKASYTIAQAKNTMTAKAKMRVKKVGAKRVASKKLVLKNLVVVKNAQGTVRYKNVSATKSARALKVNAKTGAITVPKATKKGLYVLKVRVNAKGNRNYKALSKTVTVNVRVK